MSTLLIAKGADVNMRDREVASTWYSPFPAPYLFVEWRHGSSHRRDKLLQRVNPSPDPKWSMCQHCQLCKQTNANPHFKSSLCGNLHTAERGLAGRPILMNIILLKRHVIVIAVSDVNGPENTSALCYDSQWSRDSWAFANPWGWCKCPWWGRLLWALITIIVM